MQREAALQLQLQWLKDVVEGCRTLTEWHSKSHYLGYPQYGLGQVSFSTK